MLRAVERNPYSSLADLSPLFDTITQNVTKHHMIVANGYDVGRDWVVQQSQTPKDGLT